MTREEFLVGLQDTIQRDDPLTFDMNLNDLDEWDSLAMLSTSEFINRNFNKVLTFAELKELQTVEDIAKFAGI